MAISGDYPAPVYVNGYSCRNCTDVGRAEKHIDPANPAAGPFGVNDPRAAEKEHFSPEARNLEQLEALHRAQSVQAVNPAAAAYAATAAGSATAPGTLVNLSA